ncbi:MAG: dihydrofolate reductase [bacterium]|nr:dihydrofolate reductase [bacterium]
MDEKRMIQPKPKISIVVAVTKKDAAIGNGGKLLFHISDDLKRFKRLTLGHPIIMGRKTYESIGRPLPGRTNIIVTRNSEFKAEGCIVAGSLEGAIMKGEETALRQAQGDNKNPEVFVIGGSEIYKQALPYTDKLYLTLVDSDAEGDVFFPDWRKDFTKETFREDRFDEKTGLKYTWVDLER